MWWTFIFWNDFSHWKRLIPFLTCSAFAFLKCHTFRSYEGGKTTLKLNIANTFLQWQFWRKEDWKSYSGRPFFSNIGFSWISSSSPKRDVIPLILVPLYVVLPKAYHPFVYALKSPRAAIKYGFLRAIESRLSLRLPAKGSNSSLDWLGDLLYTKS